MRLSRKLVNLSATIVAALAVFEYAARFGFNLALDPSSGGSENYGISTPDHPNLARNGGVRVQ